MTRSNPHGSTTRLNPELDRSEKRYDVRDPRLVEIIDSFMQELPPYAHRDLLREVVVTVVKLAEQNAQRGDLKILRSAVKELRYAYKIFDQYRNIPKVTVFGSARSIPISPAYQTALEFSRHIAELGYMVITGAGGGIMAAGNQGAGGEKSFGLNILLPFEQESNPWIAGNERLINFRYFFTRKLFFIKESAAAVLLPGGFGTQDEGFEALTLIQTGKDKPAPIVMLDSPGGTYWKSWLGFVRENLLGNDLISADDGALFKITDDINVACQEIVDFYRRYDSSRYVNSRRRLVIRMKSPLSQEQVGKLNRDFADILTGEEIHSCAATGEENRDEPELSDLPRLWVPFDQRHFGGLRRLIDAINQFP